MLTSFEKLMSGHFHFVEEPRPYNPPPMKIAMLLHFYACVAPFAPEAQRTSPAYTKFVKQLLAEGMIERPSKRERRQYPGWAYRTTDMGDAYVHALRRVQLPILQQRYVVEMR